MSFYTYIASDCPLEEVKNPRVMTLSVNQALEKGIELSEMALNSTTIDRDKPNVILWAESEESLNEITIRSEPYPPDGIPLNLQFCAALEWKYTEKRAEELIAYLRKALEKSTLVEIWHVWLGINEDKRAIKKYDIPINELTPADFEKLFNYSEFREGCISVTRA